MRNPHRLPWLLAALVCLAAGGASAAEPAAGRTEPAAEKPQAKIEIAPGPAPKREPEAAPAAKPHAKPEAAAEAGKPTRSPDGFVEFVGTPASQVVAFIADYAGVNIITDPDCADKLKTPVSFRARGMTCRQVLDWALRLSGTDRVLTDGVIFVTAREKLPKPVDAVEAVRKFLADNPGLGLEPAQFEPPPEMGLPGQK
jgi:hypothetical protein